MVTSGRRGFGPALLEGLVELGPVEPFSGDLALELGISVWLRRSGTSLVQARGLLLDVRRVVLAVCGLDAATEPVPLVGRSPRHDVVNLATYVADLLRRGAAHTELGVAVLVALVVAELPEPAEVALGA